MQEYCVDDVISDFDGNRNMINMRDELIKAKMQSITIFWILKSRNVRQSIHVRYQIEIFLKQDYSPTKFSNFIHGGTYG